MPHPLPRLLLASCFLLLASSSASAQEPTTQKTTTIPWGPRAAANIQTRLSFASAPSKGGKIAATVELRNTGDTPIELTSLKLWFMVAQGKSKVFFTASQPASPKISLDAGTATSLPFDPSALDAFTYDPALQLVSGIPTAPANTDAPKKLGALADILPTGRIRAKAFLVFTTAIEKKNITDVVPSNSLDVTVDDGDFAKLSDAAKKSTLDDLIRAFHADAVTGKNAHAQALKLGAPAVQPLIDALADKDLTPPGRMWLVATLIALGDKRAVDPLIAQLDNPDAAQVIAYHGPKLKSPKLTAAIEKTAAKSNDPKLVAWAARGLGNAGKPLSASMLETMVKQSDPEGRAEAVVILLEQSDKSAIPLLVQLIADPQSAVRVYTIQRIAFAKRTDAPLLDAIRQAQKNPDEKTAAAAKAALKSLDK